MSMITVSVELPEGVSIDTSEYRASHGHPVNADGEWAFARAANPDPSAPAEWMLGGTLLDAVEELPPGEWVLLP